MRLDTDKLCPCVLRASVFDGFVYPSVTSRYASRVIYDYEMEYYTDSRGGIIVNGEFVPASSGDVHIRKPGERVAGVPPYRCYLICFDVAGDAQRSCPYEFGRPEEARPCYENPILDALPTRIACPPGSGIEKQFEKICQLEGFKDPLSRFAQRTALMTILCQLAEWASSAPAISPGIKRAARYITGHFSASIAVQKLIAESGMSRATFHRRFLSEMGRTPLEMITELRMARAREMLLLTDAPVADIADLCGYPDNSYFARIFKKHCGMSPVEFRSSRSR